VVEQNILHHANDWQDQTYSWKLLVLVYCHKKFMMMYKSCTPQWFKHWLLVGKCLDLNSCSTCSHKTPEINSGISVPFVTLLMQLVKGHGNVLSGLMQVGIWNSCIKQGESFSLMVRENWVLSSQVLGARIRPLQLPKSRVKIEKKKQRARWIRAFENFVSFRYRRENTYKSLCYVMEGKYMLCFFSSLCCNKICMEDLYRFGQ